MERQLGTLFASGDRKLLFQGLLVNTDTHRTDFKSDIQHRIVDDDIAVQLPVVIVRRAAVVGFAGGQCSAYLLKENGTVLLGEFPLALVRTELRIGVLKFLCAHKGDLIRQEWLDIIVALCHMTFGLFERLIDLAHMITQSLCISLLLGDDLLPVPLVDIDRVEVVSHLVAADGVHVGIEALA